MQGIGLKQVFAFSQLLCVAGQVEWHGDPSA